MDTLPKLFVVVVHSPCGLKWRNIVFALKVYESTQFITEALTVYSLLNAF